MGKWGPHPWVAPVPPWPPFAYVSEEYSHFSTGRRPPWGSLEFIETPLNSEAGPGPSIRLIGTRTRAAPGRDA